MWSNRTKVVPAYRFATLLFLAAVSADASTATAGPVDVCAASKSSATCAAKSGQPSVARTKTESQPGGVVLIQRKFATSLDGASEEVVITDSAAPCNGPVRWTTGKTKCLDVKSGSTANGTPLQLWFCFNGKAPNQQFKLPAPGTNGTIVWATQPTKCVDVAAGVSANGNKIQLWDCVKNEPNQLFQMPASGIGNIRWAKNPSKCLDVTAGSSNDGNPIQLWDCVAPGPNQQFELPSTENSCGTSGLESQPAYTAPAPAGPAPTPVNPAPVPVRPAPAAGPTSAPGPAPPAGSSLGWRPSGAVAGVNAWCQGPLPVQGWDLRNTCPSQGGKLQVKALTYNLFWWNLFGQRGGAGGSAGKLIAAASQSLPFDVMGFQECEDVWRVLQDGQLSGYSAVTAPHAICIAWRSLTWDKLDDGFQDVAEDQPGLYGRRAAHWVRLRHKSTGQTLFFLNHHGPLPVNSGGLCPGGATGYNILQIMGQKAKSGDMIIMTCDCNQGPDSETGRTLSSYLNRVYTGMSFGGVDHFFSNCAKGVGQNLGGGGSDHDALATVWTI